LHPLAPHWSPATTSIDAINSELDNLERSRPSYMSPAQLLMANPDTRPAVQGPYSTEAFDALTLEELQRIQTRLENAMQSKQTRGNSSDEPVSEPVRIYVDGCFDLMHSGHYNALRQAKLLEPNSVLVAGVHSDAEITEFKGIPVFKNDERMGLVTACKWVDEVVFDVPYCPTIGLLDKLNCAYAVHGDDLSDTFKEVSDAGRLRVVKRTEGISTTDIVGRLLLITQEQEDAASSSHDKKESSFLPTTRRIMQFAAGVAPQESDRVVYIDGSFDLFHPGHVAALKAAKEMGDFLYVGLHSDEVVNREQGDHYPICTLHERALCVLACNYVDEVIFGAPWQVSKELMTLLNVSVVVECTDIKFPNELDPEKKRQESERCYAIPREQGAFVHLEERGIEVSDTPDVLHRIVENHLNYQELYAKKSAKEAVYKAGMAHVQEL